MHQKDTKTNHGLLYNNTEHRSFTNTQKHDEKKTTWRRRRFVDPPPPPAPLSISLYLLARSTRLKVELLRHAEHEAVLDRRHDLSHGVLLVVHRSGDLPARLDVDGAVLHVDLQQLAQLLAGVDRADLISEQPVGR